MGSLTTIARQRPYFFGKVVQSFETLQGKLISFIYLCMYHPQSFIHRSYSSAVSFILKVLLYLKDHLWYVKGNNFYPMSMKTHNQVAAEL